MQFPLGGPRQRINEIKWDMKSKELLENFTAYCAENPEQRFFQALRNWLKVEAVLVWRPKKTSACMMDYSAPFADMGLEDLFYWESKK